MVYAHAEIATNGGELFVAAIVCNVLSGLVGYKNDESNGESSNKRMH